jgi:pimeloyl-ACP methyl ester carboxylesterase
VTAIDNRGHGQSDKPHNADAYGSNMSDDVIRLMDHLKIKKAHVLGYSMGGHGARYGTDSVRTGPCWKHAVTAYEAEWWV